MDRNSTRFLKFVELDTSETDLIADAYGIDHSLCQLIPGDQVISIDPGEQLVKNLMNSIREQFTNID